MEIDMRSAQNMFRFLRTLKAEDMALDRIKFVLNRSPGLTDLSGKARVRRVAESRAVAPSEKVKAFSSTAAPDEFVGK